MHVGIAGGADAPVISRIRKALEDADVRVSMMGQRSRHADLDMIMILGGDKGVRAYFRRTALPKVPVLGLGEAESSGFLAQIDYTELAKYASQLKRGGYDIEEVPRLQVRIDEKGEYPVLNDAAVFPAKSAMLMEYTLLVNGQEVWHDNSDGVIISTPMGSSAYSMSAGGPVIFPNSQVFGIISVNSLDVTRRPLVVPSSGTILVDEVSSRLHCEAVLDGIERHSVHRSIECTMSGAPARVIRLKKDSAAISAMAIKVHLAEELLRMPPSSKLLLKTLEHEGSMTQRQISKKTLLPDRTVRLALQHLREKGYVKRRASTRDARQKIYEITQPADAPTKAPKTSSG